MKKEIISSGPVDNEYIIGILNENPETLERIYKNFFPSILQLVLNNNGDEDDAKDVFQEAIIVLYNKVKTGNFVLSSKLKTFIYSVCRRLWLKRLHEQSRLVRNVHDFDEHFSVDEDLELHAQKDLQFKIMESALNKLGEPCKTIILDYYIQNKSMTEISEKFGYTNSDNAKTQKYKCLQRLKKLFFQSNMNSDE